jgi:hypothetical protein
MVESAYTLEWYLTLGSSYESVRVFFSKRESEHCCSDSFYKRAPEKGAAFRMIQEATRERRAFWPWADDVLFWGMNIGLIGFVISLITNASILEPVFTPIMGLSILVALVAYVLRMRTPGAAAEIKTDARSVDVLKP